MWNTCETWVILKLIWSVLLWCNTNDWQRLKLIVDINGINRDNWFFELEISWLFLNNRIEQVFLFDCVVLHHKQKLSKPWVQITAIQPALMLTVTFSSCFNTKNSDRSCFNTKNSGNHLLKGMSCMMLKFFVVVAKAMNDNDDDCSVLSTCRAHLHLILTLMVRITKSSKMTLAIKL